MSNITCPKCNGCGEVLDCIAVQDAAGNEFVIWTSVVCNACGGDGEV